MNKKNSILVLCYQRIPYIAELAKIYQECNFYIHVDKKSSIEDIKSDFIYNFNNVFWIENRIEVNWGGFSIVQAILNLIEASLDNLENTHFHLISGNCLFLDNISAIGKKMEQYPENSIFIELSHSLRRRYRIRFNTPHADTKMQRSYLGRGLTKLYQYLDKLIPVSSTSTMLIRRPFGNMWFSANRKGLELLYSSITRNDIEHFRKKLVPDEHFFQYIILKNNLERFVSDNHRYINFIGTANHPELLNLDILLKVNKDKYWIARKANDDIALNFLEKLRGE